MLLKVGAHVSIADGVHKAVERQHDIGGNCGQIFTHSPRTWKPPSIDDEDAEKFRAATEDAEIGPWISHASYLINMGSSKKGLWRKSAKTMKAEVEAAEKLGLMGVCVHPGTSGKGSEESALDRIVDALDQLTGVVEETTVLLENTAGAGTQTCYNFEHLSYLIENTELEQIGVLLDTCHLYAAGFDVSNKEGIDETFEKFDDVVGLDNLKVMHLNDSQGELGGNLDRHEHIGQGHIGDTGFKKLLTHKNLKNLPFVLETPVNDERDHAANIAHVKKLLGV